MPILYGYTALKNNCVYAANNSLDSDSYNPPGQNTAPYLTIYESESQNTFLLNTDPPNPNYTPTYNNSSTLYIEFNDGSQTSNSSSLPSNIEGLYINSGALTTFGTTFNIGDTIYIKVFEDANGDDNYIAVEYLSSPADAHYFSFVTNPCLTDTCDVLTPNGYVNVKDLSVGDKVTTPEGENVKITKVMKPTEYYAMGKAYPHFIPKNSLGENKPSKDTFISKNHAYKSGDGWLCGQFNIEHNAINWDKDFVTYYNIMTEDYPKHTLVVNGVEMESWGGYEHNKPETHGNIKLRREKLGFK